MKNLSLLEVVLRPPQELPRPQVNLHLARLRPLLHQNDVAHSSYLPSNHEETYGLGQTRRAENMQGGPFCE